MKSASSCKIAWTIFAASYLTGTFSFVCCCCYYFLVSCICCRRHKNLFFRCCESHFTYLNNLIADTGVRAVARAGVNYTAIFHSNFYPATQCYSFSNSPNHFFCADAFAVACSSCWHYHCHRHRHSHGVVAEALFVHDNDFMNFRCLPYTLCVSVCVQYQLNRYHFTLVPTVPSYIKYSAHLPSPNEYEHEQREQKKCAA